MLETMIWTFVVIVGLFVAALLAAPWITFLFERYYLWTEAFLNRLR